MKINFDITGGLIRIPVKINGKGPYYFHLDTGAKMTTITKDIAQEIDLTIHKDRTEKVITAGNELTLAVGTADSVSIGEETAFNQVMRVHESSRLTKGGLIGIIGHNFLQNYLIEIDYINKILSLIRSRGNPNKESLRKKNTKKFHYLKGTHLIGIKTWINNKGPFDFILDSGTGGTGINLEVAQKLQLKLRDSNIHAVGAGGTSKVKITTINEFRTPMKTVTNFPVIGLSLSHLSVDIVGGIIGYNFLKDGKIIVDYPNKFYDFISNKLKSEKTLLYRDNLSS